MGLHEEIDKSRAEIRTDDYAMSIGEWISLYEGEEIDIHPEFQRFYRWDSWQKSRLIESILLGIPIPPIFVSQRETGIWDVVDGLQRLSTIYQFVGILRDDTKQFVPPLQLEATEYLPSLAGKVWDDKANSGNSLLPDQRLLIKRAKIHVSIMLKESLERSKYDLFQRLNTGGSSLSDQEIRNCILVSLNSPMYEWLRQLSKEEAFTNCVSVTDRALLEQYDLELVLRFIVFYKLPANELTKIHDLNDFLTAKMRDIALSKTYDFDEVGRVFLSTFELLSNTLKGNSFRRFDTTKDKFLGGFLVSAFEAVAFGIGYNLHIVTANSIDFEQKVRELWSMRDFKEGSGMGVRASTRIPTVIQIGRELFK